MLRKIRSLLKTKNMEDKKIVELKKISKSFKDDSKASGAYVDILKDLDLTVYEGDKIAIIGPSGSGKSTILSLLAGLDAPDSGEVIVGGKNIGMISEKELAKYRNFEIGIVFQSFELILPFNVYENVTAPQDIGNCLDKARADQLIELVSLKNKINSAVSNLSGGEKQRVAIARALANNPKILLADEPTGSLDRLTGKNVLNALLQLVDSQNKTLILITHDEEIAAKMDKIYLLRDMKLELQ